MTPTIIIGVVLPVSVNIQILKTNDDMALPSIESDWVAAMTKNVLFDLDRIIKSPTCVYGDGNALVQI